MKFVADVNFNNHILKGLRARVPSLDVIRLQDLGMGRTIDPEVLQWAADDGRIVLTHDVKTMTKYAADRLVAGLAMPGVFELAETLDIGTAINELHVIIECSTQEEWNQRIIYIPMR